MPWNPDALWATLSGWMNQNGPRFMYVPIPFANVSGAQVDPAPMEAGKNYFRLWLSEMYLAKTGNWFVSRYPAVHSLVRFQFGSQEVDIPYIAGPLNLPKITANNLGQVIQLNHPLTTLMPFNGGVVKLTAGLVGMQGGNLGEVIKVMGNFAGLLAVPQLSAALNVAGPVADGIQSLLGWGNGSLHLGLQQTFTGAGGGGASELKAGYYAVILAQPHEVSRERLWVVDDQLRSGQSLENSQSFSGHDYMLFRIENRTERDDVEGLTNIREPFNKSLQALGEGEAERAQTLLRTAMMTAMQSADLTRADRRRVAQALKNEYDSTANLGLGAVRLDTAPLQAETIRNVMSADQALALGDPSFEEYFS